MSDTLSPEERSKRMSMIRAQGSKPEMAVRRLVHALGYRYRLHGRGLPGRPDLVFRKRAKVIFVHGCFWHRHSDAKCKLARMPKSRQEFWEPKLTSNRVRDERVSQELTALGWKQLVVWECECGQTERLENKLKAFLEGGDHDGASD